MEEAVLLRAEDVAWQLALATPKSRAGGSKRTRRSRARAPSHPKNYGRLCLSSSIAEHSLSHRHLPPQGLVAACWRFSAGLPMSQSPGNRSRSQSRRTRMSAIDRWGQNCIRFPGLIMFRPFCPLSSRPLLAQQRASITTPSSLNVRTTNVHQHNGLNSQSGGQCDPPQRKIRSVCKTQHLASRSVFEWSRPLDLPARA
jgi:hypothetical protein